MTAPRILFGADRPVRVEERISIEGDGTVVARSGKVEYGQGIRTAFAMIVAEELSVPITRVRVELGETALVPWDFGTFGSLSVATDGKALRTAAAYARGELIRRASEHLRVPAEALSVEDGRISTSDGRSTSYEQLVAGDPLTGLVAGEALGSPSAASGPDRPLRVEARDIVSGRACFVADVRLPSMLRGYVVAPPARGARLRSLREESARTLPGVVLIERDGDFVGVVADREEHALLAAGALEAEWEVPESSSAPATDLVLRDDEDVEAAFDRSIRRHQASFHLPHISHAPIGPSAAVADVRADGVDLYVATQRPFGLREQAAALLGVPEERVRVHPRMASGTYGRNNANDAAIDAVRLSRAAGRPVLVQWSRADEFLRSPHRPELDATIDAALDERGRIIGWRSDVRTNPHTYGDAQLPPQIVAMTSGRNAVPPYQIGSARIALHVVPAAVRTGAFRSLAAAPNTFATECFVDELAYIAGEDPIAYRLAHLGDARLRKVLEAARTRSGWESRAHPSGRGLGVACAVYHGTYVAQVVEVSVPSDGVVRLERAWCVADPGALVHPDGGRNQIEGGVQQAASWTLLEQLPHRGGTVTAGSFKEYPIATFDDAPHEIDVVFTPEPDAAPTGLGEAGSVPTAAAIANAVFAATGARIRKLPLSPEVVRKHVAGRAAPV